MSYDHTGPWRPEKPGPHAPYEEAQAALAYFGVDRKIPKDKLVLGVPFYGYGFGPESHVAGGHDAVRANRVDVSGIGAG